jgi:nucleoside 2-deoxyribosyltransferase
MPVRRRTRDRRGKDLAADIAAQVALMLDRSTELPLPPQPGPDDGLVFVISPFAPEMDAVYLAISGAAGAVGLHAERVKDIKGDYRITDQILAMIGQARFIVADLTYERPNVYFELGYARGLGKKVITILRAGTIPHFDVRDWTYLEYIDSRPLEADLIEQLKFELRGD